MPAEVQPDSHTSPVVRCERLIMVYRSAGEEVHALRGVDAEFGAGTVTAVVGRSGSGKSTLLRLIAGLERPTAGSVEVAGTNLALLRGRAWRRLRRKAISFVHQRPARNLLADLTAIEHLELARRVRAGDASEPAELLALVGLDHRAGAKPSALSGGEQQRLAMAMAVVGAPTVVVADEPTAELDSEAAAAVLATLEPLRARGTCFVLATHDRETMGAAGRTLVLHEGAVWAEATGSGERLAVIDANGRLQLPEEALGRFPDRRAAVEIDADGVRLVPRR
jgi:putative ABC transport system ATP-binding protein